MKKLFFERKGKSLISLISVLLPVAIATVLIFGLYAGLIWTMIVVPVLTGVWVLLPWPSHMHNRISTISWISTGLVLIVLSHYYAASDLNMALSLTIFGLIMITWLLISRKISLTIDEVGWLSIVVATFLLAYLRNFGTAYAWPTIIGGACLLAGLLKTRIRHDVSENNIEVVWITLAVLAMASIVWQFMGNTIFKIVFLTIIALLAFLIIPSWIKSSLKKRQERKALKETEEARLQKEEEKSAAAKAKRAEFLKKLENKAANALSWEDVWEAEKYYTDLPVKIIRQATDLKLQELLVVSNYKRQLVWDRHLNAALEYLRQIAKDSYDDNELDKIKFMVEKLKIFIVANKISGDEKYKGENSLHISLDRIIHWLITRS